eukprot:gene12797-3533_t
MNRTAENYHENIKVNVSVIVPFYLIVLAVCLVGNGLVCVTVLKNQEMRRKRWYLFLVNLSITDIALTLTTPMHLIMSAGIDIAGSIIDQTPVIASYSNQSNLHAGDVGCKFSFHVTNTTIMMSTLTLAYISINRYICICHPKIGYIKNLHPVWVIVPMWISVGIVLLPMSMYCQRGKTGAGSCECRTGYPSLDQRKVYQFALVVVGFYIPFLIMVFCYTMVTLRLLGKTGDRGAVEIDQSGKKKRSIKMMILATTLFFISWFPFSTLHLLKEMEAGNPKLIGKFLLFVQLIAFTNSAWNPFTYCVFSKDFRRGFRKICFWRRSEMAANHEEENKVNIRNNRGKATNTKVEHKARKIKVCPIKHLDN